MRDIKPVLKPKIDNSDTHKDIEKVLNLTRLTNFPHSGLKHHGFRYFRDRYTGELPNPFWVNIHSNFQFNNFQPAGTVNFSRITNVF